MSEGFIKLNREKGDELLREDPQAFLLLTQIALRARRADGEYSRIALKANQALLGDPEEAGLSRQQYRRTQKRLVRYGLAIFNPTNKGTIATLTSTAVYDINAEGNTTSSKPPNSPMKTQDNEPTKNQPATIKEPTNTHQATIEDPVTRREECKKTTTPSQSGDVPLYESLLKRQDLSNADKRGLMIYPESRVNKAIEWALRVPIKTTLIQALHWHCKQTEPPLPPEKSMTGQTSQETAAWEYNRFLENHGQAMLAKKNYEAIPSHHAHLILNGMETTISLNNPLDVVKSDFKNSMNELLHQNP